MQSVWINGAMQDQVSIGDRAFTYGDGLFETVLVKGAKPHLLDHHLARLENGLDRLKFPSTALAAIKTDLDNLHFEGDQILKIIVSRGEGERGYALPKHDDVTRVIQLGDLVEQVQNMREGVSVRICDYQMAINPYLAGIKHLNRLEQIIARSEWQGIDQFAEGVVTDTEGCVVEGTMSNLFWVSNGTVYTPKLDRCGVAGVMRKFLLEQLNALQIPVQEGYFNTADLLRADEAFLTNSLIQIWPIKQIDNRTLKVGKITRQLQEIVSQDIVC